MYITLFDYIIQALWVLHITSFAYIIQAVWLVHTRPTLFDYIIQAVYGLCTVAYIIWLYYSGIMGHAHYII